MRVRIVKRDGEHAAQTQVTDVDTGERVEDVVSYRIEASVEHPDVKVLLTRYVRPYQPDPDGNLPTQVDEAELVEVDTDAQVSPEDCDGGIDCRATVHVEGCFASERPA